jgi:class 3 adenylate cyclase
LRPLGNIMITRVRPPAAARTARVTVLFADLRGYTGMAERLPPACIVPLLDEFFRTLATATEAHGGTVFHMAGDGMMAGFGVKDHGGTGAREALAAGHAMLQAFAPIAARWRADLSIDAGIGVGLHLGEVAIGVLGPPGHRSTTLVGDTVNVAARLCSRARAGEVLFSCTVATAPMSRREPYRFCSCRNSNCADGADQSTYGAYPQWSASRCKGSPELLNFSPVSPRGGIGRRNGLKIRRLAAIPVRVRARAPANSE